MWHPKTPIPKVGGLPSHASRSPTSPWTQRHPVYSARTLWLTRTLLSLHSVGPEVGLRPPLRTTQTPRPARKAPPSAPTTPYSKYFLLQVSIPPNFPPHPHSTPCLSRPPYSLLPSLVAPIHDFHPPVCCLPQTNSSPHPRCPSSPRHWFYCNCPRQSTTVLSPPSSMSPRLVPIRTPPCHHASTPHPRAAHRDTRVVDLASLQTARDLYKGSLPCSMSGIAASPENSPPALRGPAG